MRQKYSRSDLAEYILSSDLPETQLAEEVAAYLIDIGKAADLESLMRDVSEIRAQKSGIVELTARSAFPLSDHTKQQIEMVAKRQYPNTSAVIINEVNDQTVIGGVRIELANADLDLTIKERLNSLREAVA